MATPMGITAFNMGLSPGIGYKFLTAGGPAWSILVLFFDLVVFSGKAFIDDVFNMGRSTPVNSNLHWLTARYLQNSHLCLGRERLPRGGEGKRSEQGTN
jgi:hypothetical protein